MEQILTDLGHDCVAALLGVSKFRKTTAFFNRYFKEKVTEFDSPNFILDKSNKSIKLLQSFVYNLFKAHRFFKSIKKINAVVNKLQPDLIVSFYEPLTGLYRFIFNRHIPCISVAHQFGWKFTGYISGGSFSKIFAIRLLTNISAYGSDKLFCIYPEEKTNISDKRIVFIPPLIRKEIKNAASEHKNLITAYLLNSGYKNEIIDWHKSHPEQEINCFIDSVVSDFPQNSTLRFYPIDDTNFIESLLRSKALISTAGYETICEAMYLGKPVLMVPVKNHFEQHLNSIFFERFGAGLRSDFFDIDKLLNFTQSFKPANDLKEWIEKGTAIIEKQICELTNNNCQN